MNGIVFDIKRFAVHDGPGIRTTVFLKGCPLTCWWCHNPESLRPEIETYTKTNILEGLQYQESVQVGKTMTPVELRDELAKDEIFYKQSGGGVTFSGGEPLMQEEFLLEVLKLCKNKNWQTAIDTAGCVSYDVFNRLNSYVDLYLFDIKFINEAEHVKFTGISNKLILENITHLIADRKKIRFRIPVVPGVNDSEKQITRIINFLKRLEYNFDEIHLLPFHNTGKGKYSNLHIENKMYNTPSQSRESLSPISEAFSKAGLKTKIGG